MYIKRILLTFSIVIPTLSFAQIFEDYSLEQLTTTAQYGEGDRQSTAQNELGVRYQYGTNGAKMNYDKATYWYKQSANNGNKYGMYNLSNMYLDGHGTTKDVSQAVYWMEQSALKYLPAASLTIGKWYYHGNYVSQDYYKAARFFKDAAFGGENEAMYYYAWCFAYGQGVKMNFDNAFFWANRAIEDNNYSGYQVLGNMYRYGQSTSADPIKAKYYYERGAEQNNWPCLLELWNAYLTDFFGERDIDKAVEYFNDAASKGNTTAMTRLGDINFYEEYGIDDLSTAAYWYQRALDAGAGGNYYKRLVWIYRNTNNYPAALKIYLARAEQGDTDSLNEIAYFYADGKGVDKDFTKAISYIDKAIALAPDNPNYLDSKGEILLKKGDIKGATKAWKKLNSSFPLYYQDYQKENDGDTTPLDEYMKAHSK